MSRIRFTEFARQDFYEILDYLSEFFGNDVADAVQDDLESAVRSLLDFPQKGNVPPELERSGDQAYRELHRPPYRIIYESIPEAIYIHAILDARRNVQEELTRRQLR